MQNSLFIAMFSMAFCALTTGASAGNVYRCGNAYSQTPCPGGEVIETMDPRTSAQKLQADLASGRDARLADTMEKSRLEQEKKDLAANTPLKKPANIGTPKKTSTPPTKIKARTKKKNESEFFTSQFPGEKQKKPAAKKSTPTQDLNRL